MDCLMLRFSFMWLLEELQILVLPHAWRMSLDLDSFEFVSDRKILILYDRKFL